MAVHYDISSLDSNKTILETLHDIQKYLKANPIYKVYYANGSYAIGQAQYSISLLGNNQGQIAEGDVVFFNNNFYAKISSVGTETFSVFPATAIQGSGGAQIKTMSQLEFLNVISLLYDDNAGAHINMSGRTEYTDGTETPNTLELLVPFVPKDNSIKFEASENFEQVKVSLNSKVVSNPNLLINPDFAINQRGQSSYSSAGYTVDRFYLTSANGKITPSSSGITFEAISDNSYIQQRIENGFNLLKGKKLTLSMSINDTIYSVSGTMPSSLPSSTANIGTISATDLIATSIYVNNSGVVFLQIGLANSKSITVNWVKLELGEFATDFVPPFIAEELSKCQRYYQKYSASAYGNYFGLGIAYWSKTKIAVPFKFNEEMRTSPTFIPNGNWRIVNTDITKSDITLTADQMTKYGCAINATSDAGGLTSGSTLMLTANNDNTAYIAFDAELY